ncbi:MAG TPA: thiamine pyrophosphate-binding protein, partial [Polyangia bacterium]|nr:thiamine pyrophosphate-binding protein [Polyangia bacterium]
MAITPLARKSPAHDDSTPAKKSKAPVAPAKLQTGAEALIRCLEREGVEYVFGLSGGAAMPIFDALVDSKIKL